MKCLARLPLIACLLSAIALSSPAQSIHLNAGVINTARAEKQAPQRMVSDYAGSQLRLMQFDGSIQPEWVAELEQSGLRIVDYIPDNAYLVYGGSAALKTLRARAKHVKWEGAYLAADKIHPRARPEAAKSRRERHGEDDLFAIQLILDDQPNAETVALLTSLAKEPLQRNKAFHHYRNIVVRMDPAEVETIAARPDVISIAPYVLPRKFDERQGIIVSGQLTGNLPSGPGYLAWLTSKGFTQQQFTDSGLVVDVCDSGLDNGSTNANHFGLYVSGNTGLASRVAYARLEGTPNSGSTIQGCDGHGTLNAHIIGGYNNLSSGFPHQDSAGYRYGLGIAPFVRLGSSTIFDSNEFTSPDYEDMISRAYRDGAKISSDSWGADTYGGYDIDAQQYDALVRDAQQAGSAVSVAGNQGMTIVFAAGNAGSGAGTVGSPGTAKNVITVGAAENVHSHAITNRGASTTGLDGCDTPDSEANSANDIVGFSSRGPCSDGRKKPEIVAPGTHVTGGVAQEVKAMSGNGNDLSCFDASGVCALQDNSGNYLNFFPTNQQWYSTSSGTSHSTPAVAGGAALVYQYFLNQGWGAPSPAMVKAYLMNSARYMTGADAGDSLWSNNQGMGMMNLGLAFDGATRIRRDQLSADTFTASGQSRGISGRPLDTNKPVRITLSWTDAPGSTSGNAYKNNLDLSVSAGGKTYLGNVFSGAFSAVGGTADARNNTESVFLPAGTTGAVVIVVAAANINSDGVPNVMPALDQDYALVIYNFEEVQMPVVVGTGSSLQQESCGVVGNGAIDPDETVTMGFVLQNAGTANTTNVVATLLATGGVVNPDGPASYGALLAGGAPKTNSFTFSATGECGGTLTASLVLADNGVDLGVAEFTFRLGGTIGAEQSKTNSTKITLNDNASASPYPSTIAVSGLAGTISKVTATLRGFTHTWPEDVDVILVSPGGQAVSLMGAAGGGTSVSGATLTFDDAAASALGVPITSGTYQPSGMAEAMNSPAPQPPYGAALADFNGGDPNGTWKLYALDAAAEDFGSIAQGWAISVTAAEPLCCGSNKPPIFAALGNQSVVESNLLSFAVVATDPYDGDPITLTASNLPAGSTFPVTNGLGTFIWESPEPTGTYSISFYAEDKDGATEKTISIAVLPTPYIDTNCMVVISEYVEGSSNNKAIEIFNPTAEDIDLDAGQYVVMGYQNGSTAVGYTIPLSGTIPAQGFFILANSSASAAIQNVANLTSATLNFNGDDAVVLRSGGASGTIVDSIGQVGFDPGTEWGSGLTSTADNTLRRKATVKQGDTESGDAFDPAVEWDGFALDTFDGLGAHTSDCTGPGLPTPPILNPIGNQSVQLDSNLQFQVAATPTDGDVVTLTASNLPSGSSFTSTNETGTFDWPGAAPIGTYSVTFYAADKDGAVEESISIAVSETAPVDTNCAVIFSEYVEGSSNNKAIEIFNPTPAALDLASGQYVVSIYANGNTSPSSTINLSGTIAPMEVHVLSHSSAGAALLALADQTSGALTYNGDDAIVLRMGGTSGTILDSIGVVGTDPGTMWGAGLASTLDHTLRRKPAVTVGDPDAANAFDPATEWDGYAVDTFDGLGSHTNACSGPILPTPPVLNPIGSQSVADGGSLQFQVAAAPTDADAVTLTASNLPAGATFDATNEVGTFAWIGATPPGVYSVTFYATDKDGADSETVTITVGPAGGGEPLDIGGYTLVQSNSTQSFALPVGTAVNPGGYVIVARNATKEEFQTAWGVVLGADVVYVNSAGKVPQLNGGETYALLDAASVVVDGPTPAALDPASSSVQRTNLGGAASDSASWTKAALASATPGTGAAGDGTAGLRISEYSDATSFANEFVELYYDESTVAPSNQPPVLAAIGGKAVVVGNALGFSVSAADAVDSDEIVLSASNLPPGAVFATATNAGTVASAFSWPNAGPLGVYTSTFWAVDKDGADSEAVRITVSDGSEPVTIVFQGFEGTANDTWNITAGNYILSTPGADDTPANQRIRTGSYSWQPGETEELDETLELAEVDVSAYSDVVATLHLSATTIYPEDGYGMWPTDVFSVSLGLNGGDFPATADITVIGNELVGNSITGVVWSYTATGVAVTTAGVARTFAPASGGIAANGLATVQIAVPAGTTSVKLQAISALEYIGYYYNVDDISLTGMPVGGAQDVPPAIAIDPPGTSKSAVVGIPLGFVITGTEVPNDSGDEVTLWAENLPAGATFPQVSGPSVLTNAFLWTPTATGTTVVSFYAGDKDGTNRLDVTIAVSEAGTELLAPVIQTASLVQATQFNANWLPSTGATGYRLDVATNSAFRHTMGLRAAALAPGDLMIVTVDADDPEGFDAVPLVDLDAGTVIYFTDNGWSNGVWRANEGTVAYTAPAAIPAGTVLSYRSATANGFVSNALFQLSASGDNILAYQGSTNSPQFLYGIGWAVASPWVTGAVSANNSYIPSALSTGAFTIVTPGSLDNYQYLAASGTSGTKAELLQRVASGANWVGSDTTVYPKFTPDFTVSTGPAINDYVPGYENRDVGNVTTYAVTGLTENVTYYYRAKAYNAVSNSPYSAVTSVVTTASSGTPPVLNAIGGQEVFVGQTLQFEVSANQTENDAVTLSVSNKPAGAEFYPTNEAGTFVWANASPTGEYSVVFYATDKDGSNGEAVGIYVYPLPQFGAFEVPPGSPASATIQSVDGQEYQLEFTTELDAVPVVWTLADTETGTGGTITLTDDNPADMLRFYRITAP